jgi:hypothetical protein
MGPRCKRFWLPLTRLGAFFVAVVVAGNVVLHAFRPETPDLGSSSDESIDYYARKKKRIERQIHRTIEKILGVPGAAPVKDKMGAAPVVEPSSVILCIVPASEPVQTVAIAAAVPAPVPKPRAAALGFIEPEALPFVWPEPLPPPAARALDLPLSISLAEGSAFRAGLVTEFYRRGAPDPVADLGDALLKGPEFLFDGIFACANGMGSRPAVRPWDDDEQRSVTARIFDVQIGPRQERIWSEFMNQWTQREMKYLGNFGDSRVDTVRFEDRTESANQRELMLDQRKVFWDALRRTYLARYKVQADERIRDEAWYVDRWSGADFVILPPLLGAYVFYRGLEKKFSVAGTRLLLSIEPVSEWYRGSKHDLAAAVAFEWTMKDCPLGVIVSAGLHDGRYGMDFVGIGTSLGAARRALVMQQGERR